MSDQDRTPTQHDTSRAGPPRESGTSPVVCPWCGCGGLKAGLVDGQWSCGECDRVFQARREVEAEFSDRATVIRPEEPGQKLGGEEADHPMLAERLPLDDQHALEDSLGKGGMGTVFKANHRGLRREVAMKVLREDTDERLCRRFVEEARIAGMLEHPNIVPVHDLGIDRESGRLFFTMKVVEGQTLEQVLDELRAGRMQEKADLPALLRIFINTCNGVGFAHSRGIVHRDIKPANIMTGAFGEVLVMDWGLAKPGAVRGMTWASGETQASRIMRALEIEHTTATYRRPQEADVTVDGEVLGTVAYMPPEQAAGRIEDIDERSDIYSLGAILYEMLCLRPPVSDSGTLEDALDRVIAGRIEPPQDVAPPDRSVPVELAAVAMKALATDPEERYQTVRELRADIHRFLDHRAVSAHDDRPWDTLVKLLRRNRQVSAAIALSLAVIVALVAVGYRLNSAARYEAERSLQELLVAQDEREQAIAAQRSSDAKRMVLLEQIAHESRRPWKTVYRTRFEAPGALDEWRATSGWEVVTSLSDDERRRWARCDDGLLLTTEANLHLALQRSLAPDVSATYEATYLGGEDGGMHVVLGGNSWRTGYIFQVGGYENTRCVILRGRGNHHSVEPLARHPMRLEEGRRYRVRAQVQRSHGTARLRLWVDGESILDVVDDEPLTANIGEGNGFALMAAGPAKTLIHQLEIRVQAESLRVDLIELAQRQLEKGNVSTAIDLFEDLLAAQHDAGIRERARRGLALARRMQRVVESVDRWRQELAPQYPACDFELSVVHDGVSVAISSDLNDAIAVDLAPLEGLPVSELLLRGVVVGDFSPLADAPVRYLLGRSGEFAIDDAIAGWPLQHVLLFSRKAVPLEPFRDMRLKSLVVTRSTATDLEPLRGQPLQKLVVYSHDLTDISAAADMPLESAAFRLGTAFDLAALGGTPIEGLILSDSEGEWDLSPLAECGELRRLDLSNSRFTNLEALVDVAIAHLILDDTSITDLTPLARMPLETLSIANCGVRHLYPVTDAPLTRLDCSGTGVTSLAPLADMQLTHLDCSGTAVADLAPLRGHPLERLGISRTGVTDLTPVADASLEALFAVGTAIRELAPLAGQPLRVLDMGETPVDSVDHLHDMPLTYLRLPAALRGEVSERLSRRLPDLEGIVFDDRREPFHRTIIHKLDAEGE